MFAINEVGVGVGSGKTRRVKDKDDEKQTNKTNMFNYQLISTASL